MKDYTRVLLSQIRKIVQDYCKAGCDQVRQQWGSYDNIDGNAKIHSATLTIAQDTVAREICASGQKAWILEFGKGSLMENSSAENPFLDDYIRSSLFNKLRLGHALAVVGRPAGEYWDIDGNKYISSGSLAGIEIETWSGQTLHPPIQAKHIIRNVMSDLMPGMEDEIQTAIMNVLTEVFGQFPKEIKLL